VNEADKKSAIGTLVKSPSVVRAIVFTLMKHEANKVAEYLTAQGVPAEAIHGNKSQGARERALAGFKAGAVKVLVATDIAARGIDVDDVSHVFNYDLPNVAETYVHRIGRTARAGREGWAISLCDAEQRQWLRDVEKEIGMPVPVFRDHPLHSDAAANSTMKPPVLGGGGGRGRSFGGGGGGGRGQGRPSQGGRQSGPRRAA